MAWRRPFVVPDAFGMMMPLMYVVDANIPILFGCCMDILFLIYSFDEQRIIMLVKTPGSSSDTRLISTIILFQAVYGAFCSQVPMMDDFPAHVRASIS